MFFLRFSTDAIVLLTNWGREGVYYYCYYDVGTSTFRDWSCLLSLEEFPQLKLKSAAQCSSGSYQSPQENFRRA